MITLQPNWKATTSAELPVTKPKQVDVEEVLRTLEKLYNDFTMRLDECKALDWAIQKSTLRRETGLNYLTEMWSVQNVGWSIRLIQIIVRSVEQRWTVYLWTIHVCLQTRKEKRNDRKGIDQQVARLQNGRKCYCSG